MTKRARKKSTENNNNNKRTESATIEISHAVTYLYFTQHVRNNALVLICLQDYCMHITSTHPQSSDT